MSDYEPRCGTALTSQELSSILAAMGGVRAVLVGDICLDAYWKADLRQSELSRETPHFPLPVVEERYSPGAGGNVAANLAALLPRCVTAVSAIGYDWRGDLLLRELEVRGVDVSPVLRQPCRITDAYIKPIRRGISDVEYEDPRLDFTNAAPLPQDLERALIERIEQAAQSADVLCVSDQFRFGCISASVRETLSRLARQGMAVVADSRNRIGQFAGCILKPNELEAAVALGLDPRQAAETTAGAAAVAARLAMEAGSPVCMTLGSRGSVAVEPGEKPVWLPGIALEPPFDVCGAGDTFLAAFSLALAAGAGIGRAAAVANLASGITVQKLGQTGTATGKEITALHRRTDVTGK